MGESDTNLQSLIEPACRVIAQGVVPTIIVSTGRLLSTVELDGFRRYALQCGVLLSELEPGTLVLRGGIHRMVGPQLGRTRAFLARLGARRTATDLPLNPGWA